MGAIGEGGVRILNRRGDRRAADQRRGARRPSNTANELELERRSAQRFRAEQPARPACAVTQPSSSTTASPPGALRARRSTLLVHTVLRGWCSPCRSHPVDTVRELATIADDGGVRRDPGAVPCDRSVVPRLPRPPPTRRSSSCCALTVRQPASARRVRSTASRPGPAAVGRSDSPASRRRAPTPSPPSTPGARRGRSHPRGTRPCGPAPGANSSTRVASSGVVAGAPRQIGERIGAVGVEAGRHEHPGGREAFDGRRDDVVERVRARRHRSRPAATGSSR